MVLSVTPALAFPVHWLVRRTVKTMKCPHCERTWDDADFVEHGLSPTVVLSDHVHRFCSGSPAVLAAPTSIPRGARPLVPAARARVAR